MTQKNKTKHEKIKFNSVKCLFSMQRRRGGGSRETRSLRTYVSDADRRHATCKAFSTTEDTKTCITHCRVARGGMQRGSTLVFMNLEWLLQTSTCLSSSCLSSGCSRPLVFNIWTSSSKSRMFLSREEILVSCAGDSRAGQRVNKDLTLDVGFWTLGKCASYYFAKASGKDYFSLTFLECFIFTQAPSRNQFSRPCWLLERCTSNFTSFFRPCPRFLSQNDDLLGFGFGQILKMPI